MKRWTEGHWRYYGGTQGIGLLEAVYEECLVMSCTCVDRGFRDKLDSSHLQRCVSGCSYRLESIVKDILILELKCVEPVIAIHEAGAAELSGLEVKSGANL